MAEAVASPGPRLVLTKAAMGEGRWFGSGPIRVLFASPAVRDPHTGESRLRGIGSSAPVEDPRSQVPPIPSKTTRKRGGVCGPPPWPLLTHLRLRLT